MLTVEKAFGTQLMTKAKQQRVGCGSSLGERTKHAVGYVMLKCDAVRSSLAQLSRGLLIVAKTVQKERIIVPGQHFHVDERSAVEQRLHLYHHLVALARVAARRVEFFAPSRMSCIQMLTHTLISFLS
jgi:hypothetical protein